MNFLVPTLTQQLGMPTPTVTGLRSPYGNNEAPPLRIEWDVLYEALVSYFGGAAPVGTYSLARLRLRPTRHGGALRCGAAPVERREAMLPV